MIYPETTPTGVVVQREDGVNLDRPGASTSLTPSFDHVPLPLAPQSIPTVGNWNGEVQVGPYGAQSNGNVISNGAVISNGSAVPNGQFAPSNQFVPSNQYSPNGQPVGNGQYAPGAVLMGEEESTLILQQEVPQGSVAQ